MVKKFLILSSLFLTSFLFIDKIHAEDVISLNKCDYGKCYTLTVTDTGTYTFTNSKFTYTTQLPQFTYIYWWNYRVYLYTSESEFKYDNNNKKLISVDNSPIIKTTINLYDNHENSSEITDANQNTYNPMYPDGYGNAPFGAYSSFDLYNSRTNQVWFAQNFTISNLTPDFEFSYFPNEVNDYITSVRFLTILNFVDDENYNYFYKFGEIVDWRQLYSENFINNTFSQLIKRNGIFYFKITDKENNIIVTKTFSINNINTSVKPSIEYDPDYITEYDKITTVNLLTYFYVYADENYICQQKFVDTSQNFNDVDFTTYSCDSYHSENITSNGSVYSRILLNNEIVASSTYTIYNIGTLSPESDLNFFGRIGKSLNYGGPISNMITTPVQILNTIYTAVQFQACEPVSLGTLFGHELTLPCIDVESILGHNLYMFIDLICAFYVAINIIGFILDTYNKLMDLHPDSLDSQKGRGGIFK